MTPGKSFTLIELIVVIAIIAILAAIIAPNAFKAIEKSKVARVQSDTRAIKTAALAYYADVGLWPPDVCPDDDPGFTAWDAFRDRQCGSYDAYLPYGGPGNAQYEAMVQASWDGPYLEKRFPPSPWAGSYDWEFWPGGGWGLPPGTYVSVRPKYPTYPAGTAVPSAYEVRLQEEGTDMHCVGNTVCTAATAATPSDHVIVQITAF